MALLFQELIQTLGGEPEKGLTCRERPREPELPCGAAGSGGAETIPSRRGRGHWELSVCGWESGSSEGLFPRKVRLLPRRASQKHLDALTSTTWFSSPKFITFSGLAPSQPPSSPGMELTEQLGWAPDIHGSPCHCHSPEQSSSGSVGPRGWAPDQ